MKKFIMFLMMILMCDIVFANPPPIKVDELSGDTGLACEAILCLSTSTRPSECSASISRYFGISLKYWSDTLSARKSFLSLCPLQDENKVDLVMNNLLDDINQLKTDCSAKSLNNIVDTKRVGGGHDRTATYYYRTTTELPTYCTNIAKHEYTDIQLPTYKGNKVWYEAKDWARGYYTIQTGRNTYKTVSIKKDTWVD